MRYDDELAEAGGREIAVIGMSGCFPKARSLDELWHNLRDGLEAITFFSDEELLAAGVPAQRLRDPRYVKAGSVLDGFDGFDAGFFGYSAQEAAVMDPQQRLFLEHAWEALENAGYAPETYEGLIGIYAGVAWNTYLLSNLITHRELFDGGGAFQVFITNDKDFMPTKVSYKLNLKGPSVVVQTSCSTSLVAVHLACLSLLSYDCDMALAGGATVKVPQVEGYYALDGGLASPDGHCRAFDARAAGTIFGSGVGVVTLKRLSDALADGDHIRAVIKGSAINNDGSLKVSYTAPSVEGQAEVVASAQALAGVDPESIGYIETHGTGTSLGDPIEVAALTKVFRDSTNRRGFCALGSIKTNLGHLDAAAGIAGFIKTVMALEHRQIPPSLNFESPNPVIDFASSPFFVNSDLRDWPAGLAGDAPRRAGVSSFGVGGTNAHVILEEAPAAGPHAASRPWQLLLLSARSGEALESAAQNLLGWLRRAGDEELPDAAFTLRVGRSVFRHRRSVICRDRSEAIAALEARDAVLDEADAEDPRARPVVFLFPRLSRSEQAQHVDLARGLCEWEDVFREEMDHCTELLRRLGAGEEGEPALFAVQYGLARLWMSWGVRPQALLGEGVGEWVAACLAGVLPLEEALRLLVLRARSDAASFAAELGKVVLSAPEIPLVSSVTGTWITAAQAVDAGYWAGLAGQPLQMAEGMAELMGDPRRILLEVGPPHQKALLAALGRLWIDGLRLEWAGFHGGESRRRVALPTYPFERQRYWIEPRPLAVLAAAEQLSPAGKLPDLADWFWVPSWRPALLPKAGPDRPRRWLVLAAPGEPGAALVRRLARDGREVISVEPGAGGGFRRLGETAFAVDPRDSDAWEGLLAELWGQEKLPEAVVHAWGLGSRPAAGEAAGFDAAQELGFYPLLDLAQAMGKIGWTPREVTVVASGLFALHGGEAVRPEEATVLGLCKVLPQEVAGLVCRAVDAALPVEEQALARCLNRLAAEVLAGPAGGERVALRGGQRWVPSLEAVRLEDPGIAAAGAPWPFRRQGVYLLTGGLEGNGYALARYLAREAQARLALLEDPSQPDQARSEARVRELEELGAEVLVVSAAAGDDIATLAAVDQVEERFGVLHGVIHAASTQGERTFRLIRELDREACGWNFRLKVHAAYALDRALAGRELDICILLSSLSTELGGVAYAAYTAANCFLDAFAQDRAGRGALPWRSVGWDVWQFEGERDQITAVRDDLAGLAMTPREGEDAFRRAAAVPGLDRLLVSTADLGSRLEQAWRRISALRERAQTAAAPAARYPRPSLATPYAAPESDLERRIAEVWKRTLGFEEIGVHDNFFELGGDSLVAVQVVSRLQDELRVELPVAKLYQGLTIRAVAALLAKDEEEAAGERAAHLEERRESMSRRQEFLERRRSSRKNEAV
ncbi:MAG TPA: SDR family NAD(P)-dependent oxidoreductase [Thermoanaerobaculia bacterium]|nr:SDR family NAD(P)-dependent oxidoreductase [Thermoanaerobaculia bacterium]